MKRKGGTRTLVRCSSKFLTQWAQYFEQQTQFHVIGEPESILTMLRIKEGAQHSLFCLRGMLISETRIKCRDTIDIGLIQGSELERSYTPTAINAACSVSFDGADQLERTLTQERQKQDATHARHMTGTLKTHVNFGTVDV